MNPKDLFTFVKSSFVFQLLSWYVSVRLHAKILFEHLPQRSIRMVVLRSPCARGPIDTLLTLLLFKPVLGLSAAIFFVPSMCESFILKDSLIHISCALKRKIQGLAGFLR